MNAARRCALARRYCAARRTYNYYMGVVDCGETLLRHISRPFNEACQTMDEIRAEVAADPGYQAWSVARKHKEAA